MSTRPTLTADLRSGDANQVLRKLQERDVQPDDYAAIAKNPALLDDIVAAILRHRLFTPPEEQVKVLLMINEAVWKDAAITETAIRTLGDPSELDCPASDEQGLYCLTLLNETGDPCATFERNWQALYHAHNGDVGTWKWSGLVFSPEGVKARDGARPRPVGLRWQVCELGRPFMNQSVKEVRPQLDRGQLMGMGQELPAIGAMHPKWAVSMNGETIPFVDAPDLDVAPSAGGRFSDAPYLSFGRGSSRVFLFASRVGGRDPGYGSGSLRQYRSLLA